MRAPVAELVVAPHIAELAADLGQVHVGVPAVAQVVVHGPALQAAAFEGPGEEAGGHEHLIAGALRELRTVDRERGRLEVRLHAAGTHLPADAERIPERHRPVEVFVDTVVAVDAEVGRVGEARHAGAGREVAIPLPAVVGPAEASHPAAEAAVEFTERQAAGVFAVFVGIGIVVKRVDVHLGRILPHQHAVLRRLSGHGGVERAVHRHARHAGHVGGHAAEVEIGHRRRGRRGCRAGERLGCRGLDCGRQAARHCRVVERGRLRRPGHHRGNAVDVHGDAFALWPGLRPGLWPGLRHGRVESRCFTAIGEGSPRGDLLRSGAARPALLGEHGPATLSLRSTDHVDAEDAVGVGGGRRPQAAGEPIVAHPFGDACAPTRRQALPQGRVVRSSGRGDCGHVGRQRHRGGGGRRGHAARGSRRGHGLRGGPCCRRGRRACRSSGRCRRRRGFHGRGGCAVRRPAELIRAGIGRWRGRVLGRGVEPARHGDEHRSDQGQQAVPHVHGLTPPWRVRGDLRPARLSNR